MNGCLGGCMGRILAVVLLAGLVFAAWKWGPDLLEGVRSGSFPTSAVESESPSEALAARAEGELQGLLDGREEVVRLSAAELESLLLFRFPMNWPDGVSHPSVRMRDGEMALELRLARERIPALPELEGILDFLPDTVPVQLRGRVLAVGGGNAALLVHRIDASSIPIPRRFFPRILESIRGGGAPADLPPEALFLPLPPGIESIRVEGDHLVLTRTSCNGALPC
ncbi:MAG: hypothetical protein EA350_16405 [Gemmatimonadales bacterium]|nr:MAG: hypothetical protein EA350_16405 [Gemmatimonadales bacterium]